jgi:tetratricopeptide (TPR) repeat protein
MAQRARLLAIAGQLDEAGTLADRSVELRPDHAPGHAARGIVAFCRGDLEKAAEALELAQALDPWDDGVRALRRNVAHVLAGPPWSRTFEVVTDHYVVLTDISARRGEEYAKDLEAVRAYYAARFGKDDPPLDGPRKAKVLIFDTREGFHSYAELTTDDRVESMLGYYLPRYRQLLLYEDKADASLEETRRVLYHEGFHQFVDGLIQDLPPWVNEGLAEYFGASVVDEGRVVRHGGLHEDRLRDLRRFVASGQGPVPFGRIMLEGPREFYSGPLASKYAQVWSMAHFFEHGAQGETRDRWRRYMTLLRNGTPARRAHEEAWGGVAWDEVQAAWLAWVKALK